MSVRTSVFFIWAMVACAIFSDSEVPARRVARQLPAERSEVAELRSRHNEELKAFFAAAGLPDGDSISNVVQRTRDISALCSALTNGLGKTSGRVPLLRRLSPSASTSGSAGANPAKQQRNNP